MTSLLSEMWLQLSLETEQQKPPQAVWRGGYFLPAETLFLTPEAVTPHRTAQMRGTNSQNTGQREPRASSCHCEKVPDKRNLRKRRFILAPHLRMWSITAGMSWQQKHTVVLHTASMTRRQRETSAGAQITFSFVFCQGPQTNGWWDPHLGWVSHLN